MDGVQRRIVFVVFDDFQLLDMSGPAEVFATANLWAGGHGYVVEVAGARAGHVVAHGGITMVAGAALEDLRGPIDTLFVVGGFSVPERLSDPGLIAQIGRLARVSRRVASVCNGAMFLAEAGLLEGRRAATHWLATGELARRYPGVRVDPEAIYVRDGEVWTSAGVSSGIDLALALVAEDHGPELAREIARMLVVYLHRPGGQSQFSTPVIATTPRRGDLRELQMFIDAHPAEDLSVPALARRAGMSQRHFSRVFTAQTGLSPGRYVERCRAEAARRLLETTDDPLDTVARRSGLGVGETLYRVFRRHWRISPGDYRRRFRSSASAPEGPTQIAVVRATSVAPGIAAPFSLAR
ncbi:GlxA family transcriptional regulator [Spongiactinospora sp. TRM90649]|uniref:GlxA family transcriptional regulator n=1 Tax=Spongiactinospora sp. TRM90649 TaxID=3031114 RepID=UPI0023FA46D1|nr:GlxA family transcriptional regulator [Spongiactinospora sp. TRM90649]MDF5758016.1 GlxA family transcriptional regulator [Spongiactinospora sp. TRM90649]